MFENSTESIQTHSLASWIDDSRIVFKMALVTKLSIVIHPWAFNCEFLIPYEIVWGAICFLHLYRFILGLDLEKSCVKGVELYSKAHLLKSKPFKITTMYGYGLSLHQSKLFFTIGSISG